MRPLTLTTLALAVMLSGCSSSDNDRREPMPSESFTGFVKAQFNQPDNRREPTDINHREFSFNDQNNPQAFDDLL